MKNAITTIAITANIPITMYIIQLKLNVFSSSYFDPLPYSYSQSVSGSFSVGSGIIGSVGSGSEDLQTDSPLGSLNSRQGQLVILWCIKSVMHNFSFSQDSYGYIVDPNSQTQLRVNSSFELQYEGQIPPDLGSLFDKQGQSVIFWCIKSVMQNLSFSQDSYGYIEESVLHTHSDVRFSFTQYYGH
ncbi:MAG: hypothetical protein EZS28_041381 [Streblomastix strix]|uniref:Uncharacterized protein n=1 Tax=Streblomastix strix TaxID=222440 RepID=A0A5J4TZA7_9EUKA|nr:MAG: hypothetical protein EZS28_041381 [Streblomastix strix]